MLDGMILFGDSTYIFAFVSSYQSRIAHGHDINAVRFISKKLNQYVRKSLDLEKSHTALGRSKFISACLCCIVMPHMAYHMYWNLFPMAPQPLPIIRL